MQGRVSVVILGFLGVLVLGVGLIWISNRRHDSARVRCLNHLRLHGQAAAEMFEMLGKLPKEVRGNNIPGAIPPGTYFVPGVPPTERLSWIADTLGSYSQAPQRLDDIIQKVDRTSNWNAGTNVDAGAIRLKLFVCPGNIPETPERTPALNQYVGISGVGMDSATLSLNSPIDPRAGCFRYDQPTPFRVLYDNDGFDNTLLFAEVSHDLGPWIRGGPSTVRSLDDGPNAKPPIGDTGQFGGNHINGVAAVSYASGSAKFLTSRVHPAIFRAMTTIAGGRAEELIGE